MAIHTDVLAALCREQGFTSSWAIWTPPSNGNWKTKDAIEDLSLLHDAAYLSEHANGEYIFVGLNPAKHDHHDKPGQIWGNFHSDDPRRSQDYKLRYALKDTPYWGSFLTDVYSGIVDTDSNRAMTKVTESDTEKSVKDILRVRELLGGKAVIVAVGGKAYAILRKALPSDVCLKKITHYSAYVGLDKYRDAVLQQLR